MNALDDHFRRPRNAGVLEGADLSVRVDNPVCGDILHLYIRRSEDGRVAACKFQVYGCPAAIAAGSLLTDLLRGCSRAELEQFAQERIMVALGLGNDQQHAALLAADAVRAALREWR